MKGAWVLGISCYYHDSAAALIRDGEIVGAAQEERFARKKHYAGFPSQSVKFLLKDNGISLSDVQSVVYYEKPFVTFERILETHLNYAPFGFMTFLKSMPLWIKEKLFLERDILKKLKEIDSSATPTISYSEHHLSHAAGAFYPSPFEEASILCVDGVGEWATTSAWTGHGKAIWPLWEIHFPHSLGLFYSAITAYLGFKVNSGEYKVMGLAPYGSPKYANLMLKELVHLHDDGSYSLNMEYFEYGHKMRMSGEKLEKLLGRPARKPETLMDDFHMDVASSLQFVLEKALLHVTTHLYRRTGHKNLCLSGGVALNCVANSKILQKSGFDNVWIQPAAGDAGSALGAALAYWHLHLKKERKVSPLDSQKGSLLGPAYTNEEIELFLRENKVPYQKLSDAELMEKTCASLANGKIVGWFQGKMEYGPRALGSRSILADARVKDLQKTMNMKIKFRESFRPFAPLVLEEDTEAVFKWKTASPYMLFVADVNEELRKSITAEEEKLFGIDKLNIVRSQYPAITHIDYSARLQTVGKERHPRLYELLSTFKKKTGHAVLVNTSFNVRGEPIVMNPEDAYRCFRRTDIDVLVMENIVVEKNNLPEFKDSDWRSEFELD
ncbi:MAG: carbamoyltransferase [Bacteriovoracaceae bacterium]